MAKSQWSENLINKWQDRDILKQIDEIQRIYKRWIVVCVVITAGGAGIICFTGNPMINTLGLFVAITGMVNVVLMKTWAHIKLSMFHVLWELQELKKIQ